MAEALPQRTRPSITAAAMQQPTQPYVENKLYKRYGKENYYNDTVRERTGV